MPLRDIAWAKLNLTLEVLGKRADGFHALRSLVAFAGVGDTVELTPGGELALEIEGPFGGALEEPNLILDAAEAALSATPRLNVGKFHLVKTLPVAAGLGGGSADAAAALRLIRRANEGRFGASDAEALAPALGSDVAACLQSRPAMMTGRGEIVEAVHGFPPCGVVLANPGVALATAPVYRALGAALLEGELETSPPPAFAGSFEALIDYASSRGNDLEAPAKQLAPEVGAVLSVLSELRGARLVRLSGSGATCFALFASPREALRAAILLAEKRPEWWITASMLGAQAADDS